tara:strand:+ start:439 stop:699 length:261 start_codon:yes stop_codon:yes gene_type:complete
METVIELVHDHADAYTRARLRRHAPYLHPFGLDAACVRVVHRAVNKWRNHARCLIRRRVVHPRANSWVRRRPRMRGDETPIVPFCC